MRCCRTWNGHATLVDEIAEDMASAPDAVVTVCGGGGLLMGILRGLDRNGWEDVPVVVAETTGAVRHQLPAQRHQLPYAFAIAVWSPCNECCIFIFSLLCRMVSTPPR
jgi:cysteine synthase